MLPVLKNEKGGGTVAPIMLLFLMILLVSIFLALNMLYFAYQEKKVTGTVSTYIHAAAAGDFSAASSFCTGGAKDAVLRGEGMKNKVLIAQVVDEKYDVQTEGCLAFVRAVVETETSDGNANVDWFDLKMERVGKKDWKIFSIAPARVVKPSVLDPKAIWPLTIWFKIKPVPAEVQELFAAYLSDLAAGRYKEAARYLAGPALRAHAAAGSVLGNAPLFKDVSAVDWEWLASFGKLLVARASYTVDGRGAVVIVTFYRARNGWKIVEIEKD